MRRLVSLALAVAVLVAAGAASAATLASRFPAFSAELQIRLAPIPATHLSKLEKKQKTAINKAVAALAVDTTDMLKTAGNAKKAIAATDGAFPADVTFDPILNSVVEGIAGDVTNREGDLVRSIQTLAVGTKPQTRAKAKSDAAALSLSNSQTATPRTARMKFVISAIKAIAAAEVIVKKAGGTSGGGVTSTMLDVDINSPATHLHYPAASGPPGAFLVNYNSASDSFLLSGSGMIGATSHAFLITVPTPGTGSHSVQTGVGSTYSSPGVTPPPALATSGTVDFTTWDPANLKVGGTIDVTYSNGTATVHVTGTFSSLSLVVQ